MKEWDVKNKAYWRGARRYYLLARRQFRVHKPHSWNSGKTDRRIHKQISFGCVLIGYSSQIQGGWMAWTDDVSHRRQGHYTLNSLW